MSQVIVCLSMNYNFNRMISQAGGGQREVDSPGPALFPLSLSGETVAFTCYMGSSSGQNQNFKKS
ncbi:hypothetical protein EYF80_014709 [Liparis tanakae]|uniref:Uncharacterized protein n=1 Tax=Liparis tanakae TaxID=230148 RepID=A0A4Z2IC89_9TELE|nr:hypothetical protein EYF80_014709 [Liparis tanakae]